ncbi:hypothetical protein VTO58DRAFT_102469 [Aureobasidium pullulans]
MASTKCTDTVRTGSIQPLLEIILDFNIHRAIRFTPARLFLCQHETISLGTIFGRHLQSPANALSEYPHRQSFQLQLDCLF